MKKIFFILCMASIVSCTKDQVAAIETNLDGQQTLLRYMSISQQAENKVLITSQFGYNRQTHGYQVETSFKDGAAYDYIKLDEMRLNKDNLPAEIKAARYLPDPKLNNSEYRKLFGKTVTMACETNNNVTVRTNTSAELATFPELDIDIPNGSGGSVQSGGSVSRNLPLTWNRAAGNQEVYILILFNPSSILNTNFSTAPAVERFYTVTDNGSHTIPASKFDGIPQGAKIQVLLGRGRVALVGGISNGGSQTAVINYSTATIIGTPSGGGGSCNDCIEIF
jgi:hypothetical protein